MVPIVQQLCPSNRYSIKCPYTRTPTRIVVHNTANDAPAANEITYMINRPEEISFHYAIDDKEIRQGIPLDRNAWASGDGRGTGNMYGIHIEICYSLSGGSKFTKAEQNAAEFIASLLKQYGWGIDKVTKHQDYDGKYCPHRTLDMGWSRFVNMVKAELDKLNNVNKGEPEVTKAEVQKMIDDSMAKLKTELTATIKSELAKANPVYNSLEEVPSYWRDDIKTLVDKGVIVGTGNGKLGLSQTECKSAVINKRMNDKM